MNALQIAQEINTAVGLQGSIDTIISQTGVRKTIVEFMNSAYRDIQMLRTDWAWLKTGGTFSWYPAATSVVNSGVRLYNNVWYDQTPLIFVSYEDWLLNSPYTGSLTPYIFTIIPETNGIVINTVDDYYTINYRGTRKPEELTTNTQIPLLPVEHHFCIVYKAAYEVALYLGNSEFFTLNQSRYNFALNSLLREQNIPKRIKQRPLV